jgi:hypothetical protein
MVVSGAAHLSILSKRGSNLLFTQKCVKNRFDPIYSEPPPVGELDKDVVIVLEEMAELVPEVIKASFQSPIVSGK